MSGKDMVILEYFTHKRPAQFAHQPSNEFIASSRLNGGSLLEVVKAH